MMPAQPAYLWLLLEARSGAEALVPYGPKRSRLSIEGIAVTMNPDSAQGSELPDSQGHREQLAQLIGEDRDAILEAYARALSERQNPLSGEPRGFSQAMEHCSQIISDVIASALSGYVRIDDSYKLLAWTIGESRAESGIRPEDSMHAAVALFEATVSILARHVSEDPEIFPSFVTAILALNESLSKRVREGTLAYTSYLLDHIHQEHAHERRRIARDLHDRLGERLSVAFRQLELQEMAQEHDAAAAASRSVLVKEALSDAMRGLHTMIFDLRQDPVANLEKALTQYIESVAANARVQLRVSGHESWASPMVIDETFLITREAIRNALTHSSPSTVRIMISLTPNQLRALIDDDGHGFAVTEGPASPLTGNGLVSMRERAALLGGWLTITSAVGHGTRVELVVPLSEHRGLARGV